MELDFSAIDHGPWVGGDRGSGLDGGFEVIRLRNVTRGVIGGVANVATK